MSFVHTTLNALKAAQQTMHTQFPHVDVPEIYRIVEAGHSTSTVGEDPTKEEDDAADARFERHVGSYMKDFSLMLEAVAPTLRRFSAMVENVRRYVKRQEQQAGYLRSILDLAYVAIVFTLLAFTFKVWDVSAAIDVSRGMRVVIAIVMGAYTLHAILMTMKIMLQRRLEQIRAINVSVLEKYDASLGRNVYVKVAEAFTRGDAKEFITRYAQDKLTTEEDESEDVVFDFCARTSRSGAQPTRECFVSPCPNNSELVDVMRTAIKDAWARSKDAVSDCDRMVLALLHSLADVHTGSIFTDNDPFSMWRNIQSGIDDLKELTYRRLDVASTADEQARHNAAVIIRDRVVPLFKLNAIEVTDLRPARKVLLQDSSLYLDPSVTRKEECWRLAADDPDCVWAYFHPCKGCVRATRNCDLSFSSSSSSSAPSFCVPFDDPVLSGLEYNGDVTPGIGDPTSEIDNKKGTLLMKRNGGGDVLMSEASGTGKDGEVGSEGGSSATLFVNGRRSDGAMPQWSGVGTQMLSNLTDALRMCARRDGHGHDDNSCDVVYRDESESNYGVGGEAQQSYKTLASPEGLTYKDAFRDAVPASMTPDVYYGRGNVPEFWMRSSPRSIVDANAGDYTYSTFHALTSEMVRRVVDVLKTYHHRVRLAPHVEYIHAELKQYYGGARYDDMLRPLVDDVIKRVELTMDGLKDAVEDKATFVTVTRFEEKVRGMTYWETRQLVEKVGRLAKSVKLYADKHNADQHEHEDRSVYRVYLLWAAVFVLELFFGLVLYNIYAITSSAADGQGAFRNITMSVCMFVFALVVFGSMIARYLARRRYNEQIADDNAKRLVASSVKTMDLAAQHLEHMAYDRRITANDTTNNAVVKKEFVDLYRRIGHVARAKALERSLRENRTGRCLIAQQQDGDGNDDSEKNGGNGSNAAASSFRSELSREPANLTALYVHIRRVIQAYDHCNTMSVPTRPPFPTFEIIMYALVAFIALSMLFYSYAVIDPLGRVRNIHVLNEVRANLKSGMQNVVNTQVLARCHRVRDDVWSSVMNITVLIMVVLVFMIIYFIVKSSSNYESSLYMSSMYSEGRCQ